MDFIHIEVKDQNSLHSWCILKVAPPLVAQSSDIGNIKKFSIAVTRCQEIL